MRDEVEGRPLLSLFVGLAVGLVAVSSPIAMVILAAWIFWIRPLPARLLAASALLLGLGIAPESPHLIETGGMIHAIASVASVPKPTREGSVFQAKFSGRLIQVNLTGPVTLSLGDEIQLDGIEHPFPGTMERYASSLGLEGTLRTDRIKVIRPGTWIAQMSGRWRRSFLDFTSSSMDPSSAAMVDAVSFNSRDMLEKSTQDDLRQSGLIHIVTASGLQVFVLTWMLTALFRFFPVRREAQLFLIACLIGFYALASGLSPAIVRASFMSILGLSAYLVKREPDALSALALAGVGYLIWDPHSIYSLGFQLSYVTIGCVSLFYHPDLADKERRSSNFIRLAKNWLLLSGVILMATSPLIAYTFGSVSLVAIIANLLVGWCLPFLIASAFLSYFTSWLFPSMGKEMASHICEPITNWIQSVLHLTGGTSLSVSFPAFSPYWLVLFYGCWLLTIRRRIAQP